MQTRKRAKSVSFGKKTKEKQEKSTVKELLEEKVASPEPENPKEQEVEKVAEVEEKVTEEKATSDELSTVPPIEEEPAKSEAAAATPVSEFISDSPLSATPEAPKAESSISEITTENKSETVSPLSGESGLPIETPTQPTVSPEQQPTQSPQSQELSATPPQSAFSIQSNENQAPVVPGEGKKRFGVYFFIVAFLSFVLGLGAIAAANYFGVIKLAIPHLPVAAKPIPTPMPTTPPTPTTTTVDLTTYTISILNGSTIAGKASDVKSSLTTAGYKIGTIGNADNSNFTKTEIAAKSTVNKAYVAKLEDELKKSFNVDTTVGTLSASSSSDVTVTLGSQTAQ